MGKVEGGAAVCDERLREGRGGECLTIFPYSSLSLNCSVICTNVTVGVNEIILLYLHLRGLQVMLIG